MVWVKDDTVRYVSTSNHGSFSVHERSAVRFDGTHPKIVYHKDGISTHCFRPATAGGISRRRTTRGPGSTRRWWAGTAIRRACATS
ncbi:hypothetical protein STENM36S_01623 [Streptomyces tendae]